VEIEWSEAAIDDLAALSKAVARRIKVAIERYAQTGAGNIKRLQDIDPPEYRLRVGDYRVRFWIRNDAVVVLRVRNRKDAYR
jgi:mRNA-degrading endonuclease RelE of RelBE toxin-antitoxin system